jgi:hypothetical protein
MEEPIDRVLESVENRLEKSGMKDPRIGIDLARDVRDYRITYARALGEVRQCKNVVENVDRVIFAFIPQGKRLVGEISTTIEAYGAWNAETESIVEVLDKTFTIRQFAEDIVNAIGMGCECRKPVVGTH